MIFIKYTICESTAVNGMLAWKAIAWAESYDYAVEIVKNLNANKSIHYAVMYNGVIIT